MLSLAFFLCEGIQGPWRDTFSPKARGQYLQFIFIGWVCDSGKLDKRTGVVITLCSQNTRTLPIRFTPPNRGGSLDEMSIGLEMEANGYKFHSGNSVLARMCGIRSDAAKGIKYEFLLLLRKLPNHDFSWIALVMRFVIYGWPIFHTMIFYICSFRLVGWHGSSVKEIAQHLFFWSNISCVDIDARDSSLWMSFNADRLYSTLSL